MKAEARVKKAKAVVAEISGVGLEVIKRQSFDLVILALLLFDHKKVNALTPRRKQGKIVHDARTGSVVANRTRGDAGGSHACRKQA
jgi:hypothetical protein